MGKAAQAHASGDGRLQAARLAAPAGREATVAQQHQRRAS